MQRSTEYIIYKGEKFPVPSIEEILSSIGIPRYCPPAEPTARKLVKKRAAEKRAEKLLNQVDSLQDDVRGEVVEAMIQFAEQEKKDSLSAKFPFLEKILDLGEPTKKLPKEIPEKKWWKAIDKEKDQGLSPREKATQYLRDNWMNYPVTQSYFSHQRKGQSFYKYLKDKRLLFLLPTSFELQVKTLLENDRSGEAPDSH